MSSTEEDHVHAVTSYRNMTYYKDTLFVLTDSEHTQVEGLRARPVDILMPTKRNPFSGFSSVCGTNMIPIVNPRGWMACVMKITE